MPTNCCSSRQTLKWNVEARDAPIERLVELDPDLLRQFPTKLYDGVSRNDKQTSENTFAIWSWPPPIRQRMRP